MRPITLGIFLSILALCNLLVGQSTDSFPILKQPYHKSFGIGHGLPSNTIYSVCQASDGYIWISSNQGVSRLDGVDFENFTTYNGLPDNEVFQIFEDSQNRLWFLTLNGKLGYYKDGEFFNDKNHNELKRVQLNSIVLDVFEDSEGKLWFCSERGGIALLDSTDAHSISSPDIASFGFLSNGSQVYLITEKGIWKYRHKADFKLIYPYEFAGSRPRLDINGNRSSVYHNNMKFELKGDSIVKSQVKELPTAPISVNQIDRTTWLGTRSGAFEHKNNKLVKSYFNDLEISDILKDREGNYWFASLKNGLILVSDLAIKQWQMPNGSTGVKNIVPNKNQLWFHSEFEYYQCGESLCKANTISTKNSARISTIRHLNDGNTWVVGKPGIVISNNLNEQVIPNYGNDFLIDKTGNYWLAAKILFKGKQKDFEAFTSPKSSGNKLMKGSEKALLDLTVLNKQSNCLMEHQHVVFIGTESGLYAWDNNTDSLHKINAVGAFSIVGLTQLKSNKLLVSSRENRLQILNVSDLSNCFIETDQPLLNTINRGICKSVNLDSLGNLWFATSKGLFAANQNWEPLTIKGESHFQNMAINTAIPFKTSLLVGNNQGLFEVENYTEPSVFTKPIIELNSIKINNKNTSIDSLMFDYHSDLELGIDFKCLSIKSRNLLRYFYRINQGNWIELNQNHASFIGLQPNSYTIEIKATLKEHESNIITIPITVKPLLWQRPAVWVLAFIILLLLLFALTKYREQKINLKHKQQQAILLQKNENQQLKNELLVLEQEALRLQLNPHFVFNVLNTIKGYYAENDFGNASRYMSLFSKLLRSFLESSNTSIPLAKELETLQLYIDLAAIRFPKAIEYVLTIAPELIPEELEIPSMLLQPFVENSLVHGLGDKSIQKPVIELKIKHLKHNLIIELSDNGIGINAAKKKNQLGAKNSNHESKSTSIITERFELLSQQENQVYQLEIIDLKETNQQKLGTLIRFILPIKTLEP